MPLHTVVRMQNQQVAEQVAAGISATTAGGAWVGYLAGANEILITVATVIAIVSGGWALYDKIHLKRQEREERKREEE